MKHIITTFLAIAAVAAQASSFQWGTGSVKVSFNGTDMTTTDYNVKAYLVYLGDSSDTSSLVSYAADGTVTAAAYEGDSVAPATSGLASNKGKIKATYDDNNSGKIAEGQYFAVYLKYIASDYTYYNVSSAVAASLDATGAFNAMTFSFDFSSTPEVKTVSSAGSIASGSGWTAVAVPEPSTAALALAGLAMLLKRRKA